MLKLLHHAWPWYVTGPLLGLVAAGLLVIGNKQLGVSSNFRHLCAAVFPRNVAFFKYDWTRTGLWNLVFAGGIVVGGLDRKSTRLNSSHSQISYAVFCLKKKKKTNGDTKRPEVEGNSDRA